MALTENNCIKIKNDGRYLIATMPNGEVIPMQTNLITNNGMAKRGYVFVSVELHAYIPTSEFEISKNYEYKPEEMMFDRESVAFRDYLIENRNKELMKIKSKWWYKLFSRL